MKSKIKGTEVSEYPCLKQSFHTGKVVLFTKEKEGTVVNITKTIKKIKNKKFLKR